MEIERINENTVKFSISFSDIEARGYTKEELWMSRERGEKFFWDVMDEAKLAEEFTLDGPLWIQVQVSDEMMEIIVTKTKISQGGQKIDIPMGDNNSVQLPLDGNIEQMLHNHMKHTNHPHTEKTRRMERPEKREPKEPVLTYEQILTFTDIEDIITFSKRMIWQDVESSLYAYEDKYYLYMKYDEFLYEIREVQMLLSLGLEYGNSADITKHVLFEYGNPIVRGNALDEVTKYFH